MIATKDWSKLDYLVHYAELSHRLQAHPMPALRDLDAAQYLNPAARERAYGRQVHAWHEFEYIQSLTMRHLERAFEMAFGHSLGAELAKGSTSTSRANAAGERIDGALRATTLDQYRVAPAETMAS